MAKAEIEEIVDVPMDKLFAAITQYEAYPEFVAGVKKIDVERKGPGLARATYHVSMIKDIEYTIDLKDDQGAGTVSWSLVESAFMKANNGSWKLEDLGGGKTKARYALEVDFSFPAPGFVVKKLVKSTLSPMIKSFADRARSM